MKLFREEDLDSKVFTKNVSLIASKRSDAQVSGLYKSLHKGSGIEFEEVRLYMPGDDTRKIDWKVSARKSNTYIKRFREDREQSAFLLLDLSPSSFAGRATSIANTILEASSLLGSVAAYGGDSVGGGLFNESITYLQKPKKGIPSVLKLLGAAKKQLLDLDYNPNGHRTDLKQILDHLVPTLRGRTILFIISDFNSPINYKQSLIRASSRHDVFAIHIDDSKHLPNIGTALVSDPEIKKEILIDFSNPEYRELLTQSFEAHAHNVEQCFSAARSSYIRLHVGDNTDEILSHFIRSPRTSYERKAS